MEREDHALPLVLEGLSCAVDKISPAAVFAVSGRLWCCRRGDERSLCAWLVDDQGAGENHGLTGIELDVAVRVGEGHNGSSKRLCCQHGSDGGRAVSVGGEVRTGAPASCELDEDAERLVRGKPLTNPSTANGSSGVQTDTALAVGPSWAPAAGGGTATATAAKPMMSARRLFRMEPPPRSCPRAYTSASPRCRVQSLASVPIPHSSAGLSPDKGMEPMADPQSASSNDEDESTFGIESCDRTEHRMPVPGSPCSPRAAQNDASAGI